jgi:hypothetical protein
VDALKQARVNFFLFFFRRAMVVNDYLYIIITRQLNQSLCDILQAINPKNNYRREVKRWTTIDLDEPNVISLINTEIIPINFRRVFPILNMLLAAF